MPSGSYEFHRIYAPLAALLAGISAYAMTDCAGASVGETATGPTASPAICLGLLFIPLILWVPAGIVMICCLHLPLYKKERGAKESSGFWQPCGWAIGLLLTFSGFLSGSFGMWIAATLLSFMSSFTAGWIWWGIGRVATSGARKRAEEQRVGDPVE